MTDEKYIFNETERERKRTARGVHNKRSHAGRGGRVKTPSDYLSRKVRKLKIDVPEFNMLNITVCKRPKMKHDLYAFLKSLNVYLPFSQGDMDNLTRITNFTERIEAYLSIYEKGYYLANEYCDIPVGILLGLHHKH